MRGLPFARKMLVIGAIFTIPIALLLVVLYKQIEHDVDFAARERVGVAMTHAARPLFADFAAYRTSFARRTALAAKIARDFQTVRAAAGGVGATLGVQTDVAQLEQRWQRERDIDSALTGTLSLLVAISDNSLITLDPTLDGYYVGDTMVSSLPRLIDGMGRAAVNGSALLNGSAAATDDRIGLSIAVGQVAQMDADIARDVPIAVHVAPYLDASLTPLQAAQHRSARAFVAALRLHLLGGDDGTLSASALRANTDRAMGDALQLYDATIRGLDAVLAERIRRLVTRECLLFAVVMVTIAGAVLAMTVTTRSLARRLGAVTAAIRTFAGEDMTRLAEAGDAIARGEERTDAIVYREPIIDDGRDEAAILAESYNALVARVADVNADFVKMTSQLSVRAFHDALTGLANRALFMERITQMIARNGRRTDHFGAVLFLDLDRFKLVNDSLGHRCGDDLLVAVSRRLERCLRPGDTLARLGGDEFTILLEDIGSERDAVTFADRVLSELARPFIISGQEMTATASIGIAFSRTGYHSPDEMLRDADIAMYRAKQLGKNRWEIFAQELLERASAQLQLETDLAAGIERGEFVLFYQPVVSLQTDELRGFEALVRWRHPRRGLLAPDAFIAAAEENGAILSIGAFVIREAGRQMRVWRDAFALPERFGISVNVSARQFSHPRLIDEIKDTLETCRLAPSDLHVEITESTLMREPETAAAMLRELAGLGIDVHLDDFGTGYSSLGYLHRFPVKLIKVDRSFVSLGANAAVDNPQIVATIAVLAHSLSIETTAEGIETAEQLQEIRELGCTNGQGYFISRPVDSAAATQFIADWPQRVLPTRRSCAV